MDLKALAIGFAGIGNDHECTRVFLVDDAFDTGIQMLVEHAHHDLAFNTAISTDTGKGCDTYVRFREQSLGQMRGI